MPPSLFLFPLISLIEAQINYESIWDCDGQALTSLAKSTL